MQDEISVKTIETTQTDLIKFGLKTEVVENIEEEVIDTKVIARAVIPFIRPRTISVTGECFKPGIKLYPFFDGKDVSTLVTPTETQYSNIDNPVEGSDLVTNGAGKIEFNFRIPEHRFAGQENELKFRTGDIEFKLTSDQNDRSNVLPVTSAHTLYHAQGILETKQDTILSTRNGEVVQTTVQETETVYDTTTYTKITQKLKNKPKSNNYENDENAESIPEQVSKIFGGFGPGNDAFTGQFQEYGYKVNEITNPFNAPGSKFGGESTFSMCFMSDPLAQTFLVSEEGGCFITKLDLYFSQKDTVLPVWVEIRNVVNGYPGKRG